MRRTIETGEMNDVVVSREARFVIPPRRAFDAAFHS